MATAAAAKEENTDNDENLVLDSDDDFNSMFDSLTEPKSGGGDDEEKDEGEESGDESTADGEAGGDKEQETPADAESGEETGEEGGDDEPADGSGEADAAATDVRARLEALEKQRGRDVSDPSPGKKQPEDAAGPPIYNEDELATIEKYTSEWGEVVKGEQLIRRAESVENTRFIFGEVAKFMKPYIDIIEHVANADHVNTIYGAHSDYDAVYPQVEKWVEQQPAITKKAYQQVIKAGTADEVVELVGLWKKANPDYKRPAAGDDADAGTGAEGQGAPKPGAKVKAALSPEKLAAARKLAGVNRGRASPVNQGADPGDFNSAFDEFAGK